MKDEYIIINKSQIEKRIEELERLYKGCEKPSIQGTLYNQLSIELKQILSQSTPLIPEIEKALNYVAPTHARIDYQTHCELRQKYISNLKINI